MSVKPIPETSPQNEPKKFREIAIAKGWEHGPAWLSVHYPCLLLLLFLWVLGDTVSERYSAIKICGFTPPDGKVAAAEVKGSAGLVPTLILAFAGGAIGGICNELRSFLGRYLVRESFTPRYFWKSVVAPWLGGALGLFACVLVVSGVAALSATELNRPTALASFGIGALAGYGSQEVTKWLDAQVKRVFAVNSETVTPPAAADQTAVVAGESAVASGQSTGTSRETPPGATSA